MESNYWIRRSLTRRRVLGGAAGIAGLALAGCSSSNNNNGSNAAAPSAPTSQSAAAASPGAASAAATSAGASAATKAAGTPAAAVAKFDPNATFRVAIPADRGSLDPQEVSGVSNYYNGDTHFGDIFVADPVTNTVAPHMAAFEWADSNNSLLIKLRDGIVSHDGEAFDSSVLKWSMERIGQRGEYAGRTDWTSGRKSFIDPLGDFTIVDKLTLKVALKKPDVSVPSNFTIMYMVPEQYIKQVGDPAFAAKPLGMGPFKFVSRIPDTEVHSTRYDNFFEANTAPVGPWKPWYKDLVHFIRPEPLSMVAGLEAKELDYVPDMDVEQAKQFDGKKGYTVLWTSTGQAHHIQWNTHVKTDPKGGGPNPFLDIRVRQAANYAVDKDAYIKTLLTGKEQYSYGLSSRSFGYPKGQIEQYAFKADLAKAKQLMSAAGFANGFTMDLYLGTGYFPKAEQVVLVVQQDLAQIGIKTNLISMPFADLLPIMRKHEAYGLFYFGTSPTLDPNGNGTAFWADDGFYNQALLPDLGLQKLFDAESAEFDADKRKDILKQAWIAQMQGAGWLFLHETIQASVYTDKVAWEPPGGANRLPSIPANYQFKVLPS